MAISESADDDWRQDRIGSAEQGRNPTVLARMGTGWAVIGDDQFLPGYCLLVYAGQADHLTDLDRPERVRFLDDMALLGAAVRTAASGFDPALRRINYEILGNLWPHLHAHVHPRYEWEQEPFRSGPVWRYGDELHAAEHQWGPRHGPLQAAIRAELLRLMELPGPA